MLKTPVKTILIVLLSISICSLFVFFLIYLFVYLFHPHYIYLNTTPATSRIEVRTPDQCGVSKFRDVPLTTSDGVSSHGYWIPYQKLGKAKSSEIKKNNNSIPTILFFHGNAGNLVLIFIMQTSYVVQK